MSSRRNLLSRILPAALALLGVAWATPSLAQTTADIGVTVSQGSSTVISFGGTKTYTATIANVGPNHATAVAISATLDPGLKVSAVSGCTVPTPAVPPPPTPVFFPCAVGDIVDGSSKTVAIVVTTNFTLPTTCPAANMFGPSTITVSTTSTDGNAANNSAPITSTLRPISDIEVTLTGPGSLASGTAASYTGAVTNLGPCPATNVAIDWVPGSLLSLQTTPASPSPCPTPPPDAEGWACWATLAVGAPQAFSANFGVGGLPDSVIQSAVTNEIDAFTYVGGSYTDPDPDNSAATTVGSIDGPASTGGCSSGGSAGWLALLALAALPLLRRRRLGVAALALALAPAVGLSQATTPATDQPAAEEKKGVVEEITVTGSRVRRKDLTTPAPVTVVSREQMVESGKVSIGDFLQSLPEQGNGINTAVNNGGDGSTRVNLRGIGSQYTLVLVNGRRLVSGGIGTTNSADLNSIPTSAIERVEVLKDGASAVYGSDAIAGVVNIITRRGWSGAEGSAYYGTSGHNDGQIYDLNVSAGTSADSGSIIFNTGFYQQKKVMAGDRGFSDIPYGFDASTGVYSAGSGTIPAGRVIVPGSQRGVNDPLASPLWNALMAQYPTASSLIQDPASPAIPGFANPGWRPFAGTGIVAFDGSGDGYNYAPENYLVTPQQRISLYSAGDTRLGNVARGYFEASYVNRQSGQDLAPEPLVLSTEGVVISAGNQYNPFNKDFVDARRRLVEFGRRSIRQDIDTYRMVLGVDGSVPESAGFMKGWTWDLSLNYGRVNGAEQKTGNLFRPNLAAALGPSQAGVCYANYNRATGAYSNPIDGCVPLDLFHGVPSITDAQTANLTFAGVRRSTSQISAVQLNTGGELFSLWSPRPVGLGAGYEYRLVSGSDTFDPVTSLGLTTGNKSTNTKGNYDVNELYAELLIPVISGAFLADDVELSAAVRWFNYSSFGSDSTYKLGARYRPIREVTVRGTYGTAFRAPSISDLYTGQADNFANVTDPCRGPSGGGPTLTPTQAAQCGVAANNGDDQTQHRSRVGGNPDLNPETAKVWTVGVVLEPVSLVKNLTVTLDVYNIEITKNITTVGESTILQRCYDGSAPQYCGLVARDPTTQFITSIMNTNQNVGSLKTAGVDVALRYALPLADIGRFSFLWDGNFLNKIDQELADGTVVHGKNTFDLWALNSFGGAGGAFPAFKFNAAILWALRGWGAGVSMRYLGPYHECGDSAGDFSGSGLCYVDSTYQRKVSSYQTYDIFGSYTLASSAGRTSLQLGMQNMFDAAPAKIYNGFASSTDQYNYDQMGRYMYVRLAHNY